MAMLNKNGHKINCCDTSARACPPDTASSSLPKAQMDMRLSTACLSIY